MVSLMGQQADGDGSAVGGGGGGAAAANGGEHLSLPGASAASAFQAVQPVQQSERLQVADLVWSNAGRLKLQHGRHCRNAGWTGCHLTTCRALSARHSRPRLVDCRFSVPLPRCLPVDAIPGTPLSVRTQASRCRSRRRCAGTRT